MDRAPVNRTCKGCRLSKVRCTGGAEGEQCSRCARLNLECVREVRGNSAAARLKTAGICALKLDRKRAAPHETGRRATEIEMVTKMALAATGPQQQALVEPLLRRCAQSAWYHNDTQLMAWILGQAADRGLSLADFAPGPFLSDHLEPPSGTGTPPAYIRQLLGAVDMLAVAFVQMSDADCDWFANDKFDEHVCSRSTLRQARSQPPCEVSALFSPAEEIEPFGREVYSALFAGLAPTDDLGASGAEDEEAAPEPAVAALHSEIIDSTSAWRVRLSSTELVSCNIVFRCAVLRGGAEVWVVGGYMPQPQSDVSWRTSGESGSPPELPPPRRRRVERETSDLSSATELVGVDGLLDRWIGRLDFV